MPPLREMFHRVYGKYTKNGIYKGKIGHDTRRRLRERRKNTPMGIELKKRIEHLYVVEQYGLKSLAKECGTNYMLTRMYCQDNGIPIRKGYNVVTDRVRRIRSEKAKTEFRERRGMGDPDVVNRSRKCSRGVQGYFRNESTNENVWLRSTYEYIFAKWLNRTGQNWKVEERVYYIDGTRYRPDFFIYDRDWNLIRIVEIKGYWARDEYKPKRLNEILDVDVIIVKDAKKYIENGRQYEAILDEWKKVRLLSGDLK